MRSQIKIFGSPPRYYQGPGALDLLPQILTELGQKPVIVIDADVLVLIEQRLRGMLANTPHAILPFVGEVTVAAMDALALRAREAGAGIVVGIGGGKALDAGKGVALRCALRFISVPTVASNDSPTGMALAVYDEDHGMTAVEAMPRNPEAVIVDTLLMSSAPARFLRNRAG